MPIAHIEKHRQRRREHPGFGVGTWLDKAAYDTLALADDWPGEDDCDCGGLPHRVIAGYHEIVRCGGDVIIHVPFYESMPRKSDEHLHLQGENWKWTWEDLEVPRGMRLNRFYVEGLPHKVGG